MNDLAIFIPTYKRPNALAVVAKNIEEHTAHTFAIYFGLEEDDPAGLEAAIATGHQAIVNRYEPGYSNTIQTLYESTEEPFFMHANDDFQFLLHWDVHPMACFDSPQIMVVGVSERENSSLSAVSIVRRSYIEEKSGVMDLPNRVFYPYGHNYQDTEFTQTAQHRGVWAGCETRAIDHLHPGIIGGEKDYTYQKNDESAGRDEQLFNSRKHIWGK